MWILAYKGTNFLSARFPFFPTPPLQFYFVLLECSCVLRNYKSLILSFPSASIVAWAKRGNGQMGYSAVSIPIH